MNQIIIDFDICNGCQICVRACFIDVLRWDEAIRKPIVAYPEDCVHCNSCELACAPECLEVIPDFEHLHWPSVA